MPLKAMPTFKPTADKVLQIPQPGIGGLNLHDLEYEQEINQTPYMLNMMYKNGTFGKRYGQTVANSYTDKVHAIVYFNKQTLVHAGHNIYRNGEIINEGMEDIDGRFIKFGQSLYYFCGESIYEYKYDLDTWLWEALEPYVPEVIINAQPQKDGTYDIMDELNLLTLKFKCVYNGNNAAGAYYPYDYKDDITNWTIEPVVRVDDVKKVKGTDYTIATDGAGVKYITFTSGHYPPSGSDNVEITFTLKSNHLREDRERLYACKYFSAYGSNGSSHLFMGGGGDSKIFYSETYDATYFPESYWSILGSTEQDVVGFGLQYNILIAFKPREIYSVYSYTRTASVVQEEEDIGTEAFSTTLVNSSIGCDCPHTIQLINNQLTWMSSVEGICTLVSTSITDERNIRVISRNINRTNNLKVKGLLDYEEDTENIVSADYDSKYFVVLPQNGMCFMWDYAISPFTYTASKITDPRTLDWYLFDNFYVKQFVQIEKDLYYIPNKKAKVGTADKYVIVKLDDSLSDFDYDNINDSKAINAYYMTPLFEYSAVEYLKTIRNLYIQCRSDRATVINISYITEDNPNGENDSEPIVIYSNIFDHFTWEHFGWEVINFMNTFRRKCSIKKVQVLGIKFFNNEDNCDMSISHLSMQYQIVKNIK